MSVKITKQAYEQLIAEDIAAVEASNIGNVERMHIIHVLQHSVECYYPDNSQVSVQELEADKRIAELELLLRRAAPFVPVENALTPELRDVLQPDNKPFAAGDLVVPESPVSRSRCGIGPVRLYSVSMPMVYINELKSFHYTHFRHATPAEVEAYRSKPLQLQEGKWYQRRDGRVVGPCDRMGATGSSAITAGELNEEAICEWKAKNGMHCRKMPDDEHGVLRISIGGGEHLPVTLNYCVIRGKTSQCIDLLEKALKALRECPE